MKEQAQTHSQEKIQSEISALSTLLDSFLNTHSLSFEELLHLLKERHQQRTPIMIPSSIFRDEKLGIMESITKYLKEEFKLSYHNIGQLLHRDDRVVWVTYNNALKKRKERLLVFEPNHWLPLSIFTDISKGPLQSIVAYLKDNTSLSFKQIGDLLARDNRVIWSVYNKKAGGKKR